METSSTFFSNSFTDRFQKRVWYLTYGEFSWSRMNEKQAHRDQHQLSVLQRRRNEQTRICNSGLKVGEQCFLCSAILCWRGLKSPKQLTTVAHFSLSDWSLPIMPLSHKVFLVVASALLSRGMSVTRELTVTFKKSNVSGVQGTLGSRELNERDYTFASHEVHTGKVSCRGVRCCAAMFLLSFGA